LQVDANEDFMRTISSPVDRRRFLSALSIASLAALAPPEAFAQKLRETAGTTEGPFYPDKLPLDTDNDLLILNDGITPAVGEITHLTGRVFTASGLPVRNAIVEIWQVDADGSYAHTGGRQEKKPYDSNFQGYGRFLSDSKGQYYFRTIKPVEYTLIGIHRCPHIHVAVSQNGQRIFTSQFLVKGHPANVGDGVTKRLDPKALQTILVDFKPLPGSKLGELTANFDVVLGKTHNELQPMSQDSLKGTGKSIAQPRRRG
jgi:protocatechuate 3,4-dioxygenase, beta subunit